MENEKNVLHLHLPFSEVEAAAYRKYCRENGLIGGQLVKRLILQEIKNKSTILAPDYIPPTVKNCLIEQRRK